jgi:hypothetical protein
MQMPLEPDVPYDGNEDDPGVPPFPITIKIV